MQPVRVLLVLLLLFSSGICHAHKASDAFLYLDLTKSTAISLRVDMALRDLALVIPLDRNQDRRVTGEEVRLAHSNILTYLRSHLTVYSSGNPCRLEPVNRGLSSHSDGLYAATEFRLSCPGGDAPTQLHYRALFDRDGLHRGLLQVRREGSTQLTSLNPDKQRIQLTDIQVDSWSTLTNFMSEGFTHLLIGVDHLLFLLVLILPATLPTASSQTTAVPKKLVSGILDLATVVTAFTAAHSITLALAALNVVTLPTAWIEATIALSVMVAALNIIWPVLGRHSWRLAFGFGLVHGFGFANVLSGLTADTTQTVAALAGFNIGIEIGQMLILVLIFPLLYTMGRLPWYRRAAVPVMVITVMAISLFWVVERAPAI